MKSNKHAKFSRDRILSKTAITESTAVLATIDQCLVRPTRRHGLLNDREKSCHPAPTACSTGPILLKFCTEALLIRLFNFIDQFFKFPSGSPSPMVKTVTPPVR